MKYFITEWITYIFNDVYNIFKSLDIRLGVDSIYCEHVSYLMQVLASSAIRLVIYCGSDNPIILFIDNL